MKRRKVLALGGAAGIAGIAGCIGEDAEEDESDNGDDDDDLDEPQPDEGGDILSLDAGGTDGTYYPLAGDMKSIVEDYSPHGVQVHSTGASVDNVGSLASESSEFALIQNDIGYFAYNGTGIDQFEDDPVENLRGIASLYPETIHIVTQADSGIESVEDLEGAAVNTGDAGSGTQVNARQILETAGIDDYNEQTGDFGTASDQVRDGDIDAAIVVGGWPVGSVEDLATSQDIELVEVSGDVRDQLLDDADWLAEDTIPGGTYGGVEDDVETVSVQAMLATHDGMDEEVVEDVTTALFDNADDFSTQDEFVDVESAQDGMPIDLHAGAAAYFGDEDGDDEDGDE